MSCNHNESRDAMKINGPLLCLCVLGGASLANNLKSWNNVISTKHNSNTIQIQEQTKPQTKQRERSLKCEKTRTARVPFNNIHSAVLSVPVCCSERSSKYLERRRRDETWVEQWCFGWVMASVHLSPRQPFVVCVVLLSPVGLLLALSPGGVSDPHPTSPAPPPSPTRISLPHTHLLHYPPTPTPPPCTPSLPCTHTHVHLLVSTHSNLDI